MSVLNFITEVKVTNEVSIPFSIVYNVMESRT